jgi:hypothetical protein
VATCRFDLNGSHDGIADRVVRNDERSKFLAKAVRWPLHTWHGPF